MMTVSAQRHPKQPDAGVGVDGSGAQRSSRSWSRCRRTAERAVAARPMPRARRAATVVGPGGAPSSRSFHVSAHGAAMAAPTPGNVRARPRRATRRGDPVMAAAWSGAATAAYRPGPAARYCAVAVGGRSGSGEDGGGGGRRAGHGGCDALALKRVDEAGGVADEQDSPAGGHGADDAHLEPAAEATAVDGGGQQAESSQVIAERIESRDCPGCRGSIGAQAEPETHVGGAGVTGKQPAVAGEPAPGWIVPQRDDRPVDVLRDIGPLGEAPQHRSRDRRGRRRRRCRWSPRRRRRRRRRRSGVRRRARHHRLGCRRPGPSPARAPAASAASRSHASNSRRVTATPWSG